MEEGACKICRWFSDGVCRRYPPVILSYQHYEKEVRRTTYTYEADHFATKITAWPKVNGLDWCGEYATGAITSGRLRPNVELSGRVNNHE